MTGVVFLFNKAKGFGFIIPSNGDKEVFFESTECQPGIDQGDKVSFYICKENNVELAKMIKPLSIDNELPRRRAAGYQ
ncbi:MAG: hypothetical protein A2W91_05935 [Bacteroidetes bacterium GWF2_38_335]|nr:MAG: hypothetical protein A2W91_05935 [Bacteroidetes bacterium GWF2_38_335]OFY81642.1 MAG: hypothetical protein A2281_11730 [Bacteroidetes bacterium RIFOXYA12_FULL_38_20]HBS88966.1 cold-shock protein [Bacteroidales bacterium]